MHRCACSYRALELLVQDVTGLSLRQQRAQRYFQQARACSTKRTFGTYVRSRHLETTSSIGIPDHELLPFDFEVAKAGTETALSKQVQKKKVVDQEPADWHAEVEILQSERHEIGLDSTNASSLDVQLDQDTLLISTRDQVETSELPPSKSVSANSTANNSFEPSTTESSSTIPARSTLLNAKTSSRQNRKARRMAAGIYKPNTQDSEEGTASVSQQSGYDAVISKIEGMEGLNPHIPKPVQVREKKAVKAREQQQGKTTPSFQAESAHKREAWQVQKAANKEKFGTAAWNPRKRLSPDTLEGIRALHASDPGTYPTEMLADHFKVTPEAIRRILKSKWQPSDFEKEDRSLRWERRGVKKWADMSQLGVKPPRRWRELGVGSVKGQPEEKPAWKRGSHRPREKKVVLVGGEGIEDELVGRIL